MASLSYTSETRRIQVQGVGLSYDLELFPRASFRDQFVGLLTRGSKFNAKKKVEALSNVSLEIHDGERVAVLGRNGSGKSSFCRVLAGLIPSSTGSIVTRGRVRAIFESQLAIQPELTGRENAHFMTGFLFPELSKSKCAAIVEEALAFADIDEFLDAPFRTYSFGMQTRLGLSVLSTTPSEILILDEVFQGADAGFQRRISERFMKVIRHSGAVVFVSHSPEEVRSVCNRAIVLDQGRLVFDGDVEQGLSLYQSL